MKKIMCPKCGEIMEVDAEKSFIKENGATCDKCGTIFSVYEGEKKVLQEYSSNAKGAYKDLYRLKNFDQAYEEYKLCLMLRDNDLSAISGMIMAKIYGASLDEPNFDKIIPLIDEHDVVLNNENSFIFLNLVRDLIYAFEEFLIVSASSFSKDNVFYSEDLFNYYVKGVKEIKSVMDYFEKSFELIEAEEFKDFKEENHDFEQNIKTMENGANTRLNSKYNVNGLGVVSLKDGEIIDKDGTQFNITVPENIDLSLYPVNKELQKYKTMTIITFAVLIAIIIALLVVFFVTQNALFAYLIFVPLALGVGAYYLFTYLAKKNLK